MGDECEFNDQVLLPLHTSFANFPNDLVYMVIQSYYGATGSVCPIIISQAFSSLSHCKKREEQSLIYVPRSKFLPS